MLKIQDVAGTVEQIVRTGNYLYGHEGYSEAATFPVTAPEATALVSGGDCPA